MATPPGRHVFWNLRYGNSENEPFGSLAIFVEISKIIMEPYYA